MTNMIASTRTALMSIDMVSSMSPLYHKNSGTDIKKADAIDAPAYKADRQKNSYMRLTKSPTRIVPVFRWLKFLPNSGEPFRVCR